MFDRDLDIQRFCSENKKKMLLSQTINTFFPLVLASVQQLTMQHKGRRG